jgi:uncharacterized membrane protein
MSNARTILIVAIWMVTTMAAQTGDKDKTTTKVSSEFSQEANRALIAISHSTMAIYSDPTEGSDDTDPVVRQALNSAEEAAFTKAENVVLSQIQLLAMIEPSRTQALLLTSQGVKLGTNSEQARKDAEVKLRQTDECIDAMRKSLHKLSGDKPAECIGVL